MLRELEKKTSTYAKKFPLGMTNTNDKLIIPRFYQSTNV